jgi:hypothetical protein
LRANTTLRDCLVWSGVLPAAFLVCLLPLTVTVNFPWLPAFFGLEVNVLWATLVGRGYLPFMLYNDYFESGVVSLDSEEQGRGSPLNRFIATDVLSASILLFSAVSFFAAILVGHGSGGRATWFAISQCAGNGVARWPRLGGAARSPPAARRHSVGRRAVAALPRCPLPTRTFRSPSTAACPPPS